MNINQKKYKKIKNVGFDEPVGWEKEQYKNISSDSGTDSDTESDQGDDTEIETDPEQESEHEILQEETDYIMKKKIFPSNIKKNNGSCPENSQITSPCTG